MSEDTVCPKCGNTSGDSWADCGGSCPMPGSPWYSEIKVYDLIDRDGKPIMAEPDLNELLSDATARGLTHFSLSRMHARAGMWQAASRWTWSDGYRVAIEASPLEATVTALSMQPVSNQRAPAAVPELPAVVSVFD